MMAIYRSSKGTTIRLGRQLGSGGEGAVFHCSHDPRLVAKIYTKSINADKEAKLRWMASFQNDRLLGIAAWVLDTLHDEKTNRVAGFLMPAVDAKEIHELYSAKSRKTHFPNADWRFLVRAALNLAHAVYTVHESGLVIGDVNQGNFVISADGKVKLIDCDSYHVVAGTRTFRCEVGVPTYIPPELQGRTLVGAERTRNHDQFGLAVLIFQLLFIGRHPFSGNYLGKGADKTLEESIKELRFAYGQGAGSRLVQQPPGTLNLEAVSIPVARLFERAFLTINNRPSAREWIDHLRTLSESLITCSKNRRHAYLKLLTQCPWCEIESETGAILFLDLGAATGLGTSPETLETLLNEIQLPYQLLAKPSKILSLPSPAPHIQASRLRATRRFALVTAFQLASSISIAAFLGPIPALFVGAFVAALGILHLKTLVLDASSVRAELEKERNHWSNLEAEYQQLAKIPDLNREADLIRKKITDYKTIPAIRQKKLKELESNVRERQLENYLDRFRIDRAKIQGIGISRTIQLESYGIETAADVSARRILSINGFGPSITQNLLNWRRSLELKFQFDPNKGVTDNDKKSVENQIASMRAKLEAEIRALISHLKKATDSLRSGQLSLTNRTNEISVRLAQAESNARGSSILLPAGVVLASVALAVPLFAFAALVIANPSAYLPPPQSAKQQPVTANQANSNGPVGNAANLAIPVNSTSNVSNAAINSASEVVQDSEIDAMSLDERRSNGDRLFAEGVSLTKIRNDAAAAEKYREALRYVPDDRAYNHELGYALFRRKRYSEAISALEIAIEADPNSDESKSLIGRVYLASSEWKQAKRVYEDLRSRHPRDYNYQFNLGLAARGLNDRRLALNAFENAAKAKPNEPQAIYNLGIEYLDAGRISDAEQQAVQLEAIDPKLATKLRALFPKGRPEILN